MWKAIVVALGISLSGGAQASDLFDGAERQLLTEQGVMNKRQFQRYQTGNAPLPIKALPKIARSDLRISLAGMAMWPGWLASPTLPWAISYIYFPPIGVTWTAAIAGGISGRIMTPVAQFRAIRRLRAAGIPVRKDLAVAAAALSGVEVAGIAGFFVGHRWWVTQFVGYGVFGGAAVAQLVLSAITHKQIQKGWTLAVERGIEVQARANKPLFFPTIDVARGQIGVGAIW